MRLDVSYNLCSNLGSNLILGEIMAISVSSRKSRNFYSMEQRQPQLSLWQIRSRLFYRVDAAAGRSIQVVWMEPPNQNDAAADMRHTPPAEN